MLSSRGLEIVPENEPKKVPAWHKQQGGSRKHNTKAAKAKFLWLHPDAQSALEETVVGYVDVFDKHETIEIVDRDDK